MLSIRFSDGIDVLVRDFVAFTRDAHISPSVRARLDMSFKGIMSSIGINTDTSEAGSQTDRLSTAALSTLGALKTPAPR